MAKEFAKVFYNSARWKRCRAAYIKYASLLMEVCVKPAMTDQDTSCTIG
ncbi:MAG: hypothetical protein ACLTL2_00115 [Blautia sp.]